MANASGRPRTVCEDIGEGRIMQCVHPGGEWPERMRASPPAVEPRCTACDGFKAKLGILDRIKAEWEQRQKG